MKVLLINPPDNLEKILGRAKQFVPVLEPLGLFYIAASVKMAGYQVEVLDAFAANMSVQEVKESVSKGKPDVVGLTAFVSNGDIVYEIGRWIKMNFPEILVVIGNTHASVYAETYLRNGCCDCVVHGEAEQVFVEMLKSFERRNGFESIPSISFLKNNRYVAPRQHAVISDLTSIPLPARDMVDRKYYNFQSVTNMPYSFRIGRVAKHMFTSRGCPFSCSFCAIQRNCGRRCHSLIQVEEEIKLLTEEYKAQYIFFMDPVFVYDRKRVLEICRLIKKNRIRFRWGCEGHVNYIDEELICEMESAGCHDIAFGIESGVQRLLDRVRKGTKLETVERCIALIKKKTKIKISGLFIVGLPGETHEDSLATIKFSKRLPLDMAQFSIFVPYPGSPLFYDLVRQGQIDTGYREDGSFDFSLWRRYNPYACFTDEEPIWVTPELTAESVKTLQKKAFREFYLRPRQLYYQIRRIPFSRFPDIISALKVISWELVTKRANTALFALLGL